MGMLTIDDIKQLIASDETRTLELKKTTGELKDGMHSACAFLNTDGGWLIFGITPKSLKILGENVTDNTRREIAQALKKLEPRKDITVQYVDVPERDNCQVIAMHFDGWNRCSDPYTYDGCPYWRNESTTERMPRDVYDDRLRESRNHIYAWELQPAEGLTIEDLDENRIKQAVRIGVDNGRMPATALAASPDEVLAKLSLKPGGRISNAAAVLFVKPESAYPQFLLRMAVFRGLDKSEFRDNKRLKGNFFDLLDAGIDFLFNNLPVSGRITGLQRTEQCEIPIKALREALINALCHREYSQMSDSVSIAIYRDRVEINNPGRLPVGLTAETIKLPHESHPHNPQLADVLFKTTFLENWGSGVQRMIDECNNAGIPEPDFHTANDCVMVRFIRNHSNDPKDDPKDDTKELTERQKIIVVLISSNDTITIDDMAQKIGVSGSTIKRELIVLQKKGIIARDGGRKRGHWIVLWMSINDSKQ